MSSKRSTGVPVTDVSEAAELLAQQDAEAIAQAVEKWIAVDVEPATQVTVRLGSHSEPILQIRRRPHGTLEKTSAHISDVRMYLPDPAQMGRRQRRNELGIESRVRNMSGVAAARAVVTASDLKSNYEGMSYIRSAMTAWLRSVDRATADRIRGNALYLMAQDGVRGLMDQQCHDLATDSNGRCRAPQYNRAVLTREAIVPVSASNPAAASWLLHGRRLDSEPMQHPGQIVAKARQEMEQVGVERSAWRTIRQLDPAIIEALQARRTPNYLTALLLNACGRTHARPDVSAVEFAIATSSLIRRRCDDFGPPRRADGPAQVDARRTVSRMVELLFRYADGRHAAEVVSQEDEDEHAAGGARMIEVADYLTDLIGRGEPLRATTWNGLAKAVRRWHGQHQVDLAHRAAQREIDRRDGWVIAWNSLVDESTLETPETRGLIRVVPLTSETELWDEGVHMSHCVGQYSRMCAAGGSRIYSIRRGGETLATAELRRDLGRWSGAQVRSAHNGSPPQEARMATAMMARAHQQEWERRTERADGPVHTAWLVQPATGATKAVV